jgi:tetratricopeptide (TPR) repeat protein
MKWETIKPKSKISLLIGGASLFVVVLTIAAFLSRNYQLATAKKTADKVNQETAATSKALLDHDQAQALAHAKAALALAPDDPDTILTVAHLVEKDDPSYSNQLYNHALEVFKKMNDPDVDGKKALTYWTAAGLAEKAGHKDQAKRYYQKVINAANQKESYDSYLAAQSLEALKRLQ